MNIKGSRIELKHLNYFNQINDSKRKAVTHFRHLIEKELESFTPSKRQFLILKLIRITVQNFLLRKYRLEFNNLEGLRIYSFTFVL